MDTACFRAFRIGTRLAAMVLAATVSALLAAMGIRGLAVANESLRTVYEERMTPVRSLATSCILTVVQPAAAAKGAGSIRAPRKPRTPRPAAGGSPPRRTSHRAQHAHHRPAVGAVCRDTQRAKEAALAERFARQRAVYLQEGLVKPTMDALRMLDYADTQRLADTAHNLYERASLDIRALTDLQFQLAHATEAGVRSHAQTRQWALGGLLASMALLSFLGAMLIRSDCLPLAAGRADVPQIAVGNVHAHCRDGRDGLSTLLSCGPCSPAFPPMKKPFTS